MATAERIMVAILERHLRSSQRPRLTEATRLFWTWFADLSAGRSYHASGPNPISEADMQAYFATRRWPVEPRHYGIMHAMDRAFMAYAAAQAGRDTTPVPRALRPKLTAAAFDAVFG